MIVYEDAGLSRLGPLVQTRPVFELRCGAVSLVERQARCLGASRVRAVVRPELAALCRSAWPERPVNEDAGDGETLLVNGRWLAPASVAGGADEPQAGLVDGEVAWLRLPAGEAGGLSVASLPWKLAQWKDALPQRPAGGFLVRHPWDLVELNALALADDERHWYTHRDARGTEGLLIQGPASRVLIDPSAKVEPLVFLDAASGPVLVDAGAVVKAFSRLEGPCHIGAQTHVLAARVAGSSVGPGCRVGGEVEASIVHGHSNKAHDGFLGHSYVGEWVNLGAGTQTSDLRNDYGKVAMAVSGQKTDTGRLKVGSFIGDHAKSSIGTLLNTGSVIGPFAMLLAGDGLLPRSVPAFGSARGCSVTERTDLGQMFATARAMMARRGIRWHECHADFFLDLYERTSGERQRLVRESERRLRRVV